MDNDFYYFGMYTYDANPLVRPEYRTWKNQSALLKINRENLKATYNLKSKVQTMQCKTISSREAWRLWDGYKEQNEKNIEAEKERIKKKNKI